MQQVTTAVPSLEAPHSDDPPGRKSVNAAAGFSLSAMRGAVQQLQTAVLGRRPVFKEILDQHGHETVEQYVRRCTTQQSHTPDLRRQEEFLDAFYHEVEEKLDRATAKGATAQLKKYYTASTMDHSSPLCHPWAFHFDLAAASVYRADPDPLLKYIVTLSFSNVSLNNFAFPRGFSFHAKYKDGTKTHRHAFFANKLSRCPVFNLHPYTAEDIARLRVKLHAEVQNGEVSEDVGTAMHKIVDEIYARPDVLSCKTYADQLTKSNFHLWRRLSSRMRGKQVDLVYLQQESLVTRLLLKHHLHRDSAMHRFIFDTSEHTVAERCFNNVHDAFSLEKKRGTYLFWALCPHGKQRIQLWRKGAFLESDCGTYKIALTPDSIAAHLKSHELIPSTMLSLCLLSFYYGLHCLGGMGQVSYLPEMKAAYLTMMQEIGDGAAPRNCTPLATKNLGGEMAVAFLREPSGNLIPATLFDFLLYGEGNDMFAKASASINDVTLNDALATTLPSEYPMLYSVEERDAVLFSLTSEDISRVLGSDGKLRACGSMEMQKAQRPVVVEPVRSRIFPRFAPVLPRNAFKAA